MAGAESSKPRPPINAPPFFFVRVEPAFRITQGTPFTAEFTMRSPLIVCLFAALAGIPVAAPAGPVDVNRRDRLEPELIIESGGRMGYCDYLTFTDDGKQLLAVGDDKVVRVWDFVEGKLRPADPAVLRWSIWREQRG